MAKHSTIPVRLDETQMAKIRLYAQKYGIPDSMFIRWSIDALIKYVEAHGGNLSLPIDFSAFWKSARQLAEEAILNGTFPQSPRLNEDPIPYTMKRTD
jgi:hypothetical protein